MHDDVLLIRRRRIEAGLTQEDLADTLGVSSVTLGRWETGARKITAEKLIEIAQALGIPVGHLYPDGDGLSEEERDLIKAVRSNSQTRYMVKATIRALKEAPQSEYKHEPSSDAA